MTVFVVNNRYVFVLKLCGMISNCQFDTACHCLQNKKVRQFLKNRSHMLCFYKVVTMIIQMKDTIHRSSECRTICEHKCSGSWKNDITSFLNHKKKD